MNETSFIGLWAKAAITSLGLFWMAFWAFALGYLVSSAIQVFVTRERMRRHMGDASPRSVSIATFFGFISSSCSFAALSTSRALFAKGAGFIPALAFLLASTNLVIELGIVIAVFLSWQFVVGEYVGGLLLILLMWLVVRITLPPGLADRAREKARAATDEEDDGDDANRDWTDKLASVSAWRDVAQRYFMEWQMVWKDVTIGFTVAGIIAAFVPRSFFEALFVGSAGNDLSFWQVLAQAVVGPVAAFFTFIGSMGNIPLAAVLFDNGVSFAGIMAFIFSDLVVLPVLRINAQYYGWKMALYILVVFLAILVTAAVIMHYGFAFLGLLPEASEARRVTDRQFFAVDHTLFLNLAFGLMTAFLFAWRFKMTSRTGLDIGESPTDKILFGLSMLAFAWLGCGLVLALAG